MARASGDAARWSEQTWRRALRPALKDLWSRRTLAIGAAGAAVPAGRELIDTAAARLSRRQREERHWGVFFLGLVLGVAAGAIAALLTAPKRGSEMRRELTVRADEMRQEIASRAKDAEWVPIFQRDEVTNGYPQETFVEASEPVEDAASEATATVSEAVEDAGEAVDTAVDTAGDAVDEAYDTVDREST
jgi:gas vesicle protein